MAIAEVLFCITGIELCYVEVNFMIKFFYLNFLKAPAPLRTFVQSLWFLTIGFGILLLNSMSTFILTFNMVIYLKFLKKVFVKFFSLLYC